MKPDDLSPLYHLTGPFNIRINEREMAQNLIGPAAWALAIMQHKPAMVIEIGTSKGGLSALLADCVAHYGGEFHTFDVHGDGNYNQYPLKGNAHFHLGDCFETSIRTYIKAKILQDGLCFVLCDGGNKVREWNEFRNYLKVGDVLAAHDFCDETIPNYSPDYWGCMETPISKLNIEGLSPFVPLWFQFSAWCVMQKI